MPSSRQLIRSLVKPTLKRNFHINYAKFTDLNVSTCFDKECELTGVRTKGHHQYRVQSSEDNF